MSGMTREEAKELLLHILMTYVPKDQYGDYDYPEPYEQALTMAIEALSDDFVKVVRCKDCINYETCNLRLSHWWKGGYTVDIEFCSFGERRSNKGEEVNGFKSIGQAWNTLQERREP